MRSPEPWGAGKQLLCLTCSCQTDQFAHWQQAVGCRFKPWDAHQLHFGKGSYMETHRPDLWKGLENVSPFLLPSFLTVLSDISRVLTFWKDG